MLEQKKDDGDDEKGLPRKRQQEVVQSLFSAIMKSDEHWGPEKFVGEGGNTDFSRYSFDGALAIPPVPQVGKPM